MEKDSLNGHNYRRCFFFMGSLGSTFTQSEINKIASVFEEVIVITEDIQLYTFSNNVKIIVLPKVSLKRKLQVLLRYFISIQVTLISDLFSKRTSFAYAKLYLLRQSYLLKYLSHRQALARTFKFKDSDVLYSFFTYNNAILPALIKKKYKCKFITCTHGGDLFEERNKKTGKLSFRKFIFHNSTLILSISENGTNYLKRTYPAYQEKVRLYYLGTNKRHYSNNPFDKSENGKLIFVSCANIERRDVKRVELIPGILSTLSCEFNLPITWYHIGSYDFNKNEELRSSLDLINSDVNIKYELKGKLTNEEVLDFYQETPITAFISVSQSEGLPFTMMEAISFGIPVISTNVGGCKEIVVKELLLDENFKDEQVITVFEYLLSNQKHLRKVSKVKWEETFSSDVSLISLKELIIDCTRGE